MFLAQRQAEKEHQVKVMMVVKGQELTVSVVEVVVLDLKGLKDIHIYLQVQCMVVKVLDPLFQEHYRLTLVVEVEVLIQAGELAQLAVRVAAEMGLELVAHQHQELLTQVVVVAELGRQSPRALAVLV